MSLGNRDNSGLHQIVEAFFQGSYPIFQRARLQTQGPDDCQQNRHRDDEKHLFPFHVLSSQYPALKRNPVIWASLLLTFQETVS